MVWVYVIAAATVLSIVAFFVLRGGGEQRAIRKSEAVIDASLAKQLRGEEPGETELSRCAEVFRHELAASDAVVYRNAVKLALMQHPEHDAWPFCGKQRDRVLASYQRQLSQRQEGWIAFTAIQPALLMGEVQFALSCYQSLSQHPEHAKLASVAVAWVREALIGYPSHNRVDSALQFLQALQLRECATPEEWGGDRLTPTQRWALSVAVFPSYGCDPRIDLPEPMSVAASRLRLAGDWDINDTASARKTLEWLLQRGHRVRLASDLDSLASGPPTSPKLELVQRYQQAFRQYGILAWDLCRLVALARLCQSAGYLQRDDAWQWLFEAAHLLRQTYPSWHAMGEDYILGSIYFREQETPNEYHATSVRWLQRSPLSPWQRIPWQLPG